MRAIIYDQYGPADVLRVGEVPRPEPKEHEVLIRVRAAEATKSDCEMRSFEYSVKWFWLPLRLAFGVTRPRRRVLGSYFAGEVEQTGKLVTAFAPGDQVYGSASMRLGAYGEYLALPASGALAKMPANMTFEEAAAVPLGGLNALHFMRLAAVQPGEKVLVNGAGGVIGGHGVQIAKAMGATVTAVDKASKAPFINRLGADEFINYEAQSFTATGQRWDVIFDMVPATNYGACIDALKPGGRYLSGNPRMAVMLRTLTTSWFSDKQAYIRFAPETSMALDDLRDMVESGEISPIVDRVMKMEEAPAAHRLVETEQRMGAIVIRIGAA